jgi:hypothetical protein
MTKLDFTEQGKEGGSKLVFKMKRGAMSPIRNVDNIYKLEKTRKPILSYRFQDKSSLANPFELLTSKIVRKSEILLFLNTQIVKFCYVALGI